jgi:HlyD family secretion protein
MERHSGKKAAPFNKNYGVANSPTGGCMKKHWRAILIVVLLAVAGVVGLFFYMRANAQRKTQSYQTSVLARGTLTASIGATGTIEARQQASIAFSISGRVGTVHVNMGDQVSAGQVLIELDPAYYPQQVISAQADLVSAQKALDNLKSSQAASAQAELDLANAKKALDTAKTNYDTAVKNNSEGWVKQAQDRVDQTYSDWQNYLHNNDGSFKATIELRKRYQAYVDALRELETAQHYFDLGIGTSGGNKDTEMALEIAKGKLDLAQAQYDDALAAYNRLKDGVPAQDLKAAQARVDAAQAILDQVTIKAPFSGTIMAVNVLPGDIISPGSEALVIADLSELHVDVSIAEVDYNRLAAGQSVQLVLDAIPDATYHGTVKEIGLNASNAGGSVTYPVRVVISDADKKVLPGMTAAVQIEVSHLDDVLLVPNRAVRALDGSRVVYILQNGALKTVTIELGASNDTMSQVLKGDLKEGDIVVLNPPTTLFGGNTGGGGGGGGAFFGR